MKIITIVLEEMEAQRSQIHMVRESYVILMEMFKAGPVDPTQSAPRGSLRESHVFIRSKINVSLKLASKAVTSSLRLPDNIQHPPL